jgi:hypothetical protein
VRRVGAAFPAASRQRFANVLFEGARGGFAVVIGRAGVRFVPATLSQFAPGFAPAPGGPANLLLQTVSAFAVGWVADWFAGPRWGAPILYGAFSAPMETIARQLTVGVPVLGDVFAEEPVVLSEYPNNGISSYPMLPSGMGEEVDEFGETDDAMMYQ